MILNLKQMSVIKFFLFLMLLFGLNWGLICQDYSINQNMDIENLINKQIKINTSNPYIEVLRIQVYFDDSKQKINEIKNSFEMTFPDREIEMIYEGPYWRLYTGVFLDKNNIKEHIENIRKKFPETVIVSQNIKVDKFINKY